MGCDASNEQPSTQPRDTRLQQCNNKQINKNVNGNDFKDDKKNQNGKSMSNSKINSSRTVPKKNNKNESQIKTSRTKTGNSD